MNKLLCIFAIIFSIWSCTKKYSTPNRPPSDFVVKSTLGSDGKTITLNWTKAISPDGDEIKYNVVLGNDTLAKGLKDTLYVIKNLNYEYSGTVYVIAFDLKNSSNKSILNISSADSPYSSIPDSNFEKYLIDKGIDKDGKIDGKISKVDGKGIAEIDVTNLNIENLKGIEIFENLSSLSCGYNKIPKLDLSKNAFLGYVDCNTNILTELNLTASNNLIYLDCENNLLSKLDLSKNLTLTYLRCGFNKLNQLDISKNTKLLNVNFTNNSLTQIDVTKNLYLESIHCSKNQISQIDVSQNQYLKVLYCENNSLVKLDLTKNSKLINLLCRNNKIIELNLTNNFKLFDLDCSGNQLTFLDLSKNTLLYYFNCRDNKISTICVIDVNKINSNYWGKDDSAVYKKCD